MRKFILTLSLFTVFLTACSGLVGRSAKPTDGEATLVPVQKTLGAFYPIAGTHYQMASIATDQSASDSRSNGYDLSQLFSSGRSDYGVYNYVFFDVEAEKVQALLPDNQNIILSVQGYPTPNATVTPEISIAWWLYTLVKQDTNEDGALTYTDSKTLSISDVGGNGYTELIVDVEQVLGDAYKDGNKLLVIYRSKGKNFLASIDLTTRKVTRTSEFPSFGNDVK
jgi:hypothetical protein